MQVEDSRWEVGQKAFAPGEPKPWPVTIVEVQPNDWVLVEYEEGDRMRWKRWELTPRS